VHALCAHSKKAGQNTLNAVRERAFKDFPARLVSVHRINI